MIVIEKYKFRSDFESGNLRSVEKVKRDNGDYEEFDVWTRPDCWETEFSNGNRTWFYFCVSGFENGEKGMKPFWRVPKMGTDWAPIREKPGWVYEGTSMVLTFVHTFRSSHFSFSESTETFFSFCYPFTYQDLVKKLNTISSEFKEGDSSQAKLHNDNIYIHRETLVQSLDGNDVEMLTISS
eukprot:Sdes_comp8355_c0_seq1m34